MHPVTMSIIANQKIAEEHAWAQRQRLARIARGAASPDAISFEGPLAYHSFATRVRSAVAAVLSAGRARPARFAGG